MADTDVLKMKVADLKRELKLRGLVTTGNKNELQERLQTALLDGDLTLEDASISEDLLDDDALTDDEDKGLDLSNEDAVLQSPDKEEDKSLEAAALAAALQPKKVVLKRKTSITIPPSTVTAATTSVATDSAPVEKIPKLETTSNPTTATDGSDSTDKKVVKLSELSIKDRLEMRAKKFGAGVASTDAAKLARAERFGTAGSSTNNAGLSNSATAAVNATTSMDVLKKRAERFGCSVSSRMVELERKAKLQLRQARFGDGATADDPGAPTAAKTNGATATNTKTNYEEKAKQRLERFKTAVK